MNTDIIPANPSDPLAPIDINDVVIPGDTWTSGKILPSQESDPEKRLICEEFLTIRTGSESISITLYWYDGKEWVVDDQAITVSAWRRIPMDGIDEAVRLGDQP